MERRRDSDKPNVRLCIVPLDSVEAMNHDSNQVFVVYVIDKDAEIPITLVFGAHFDESMHGSNGTVNVMSEKRTILDGHDQPIPAEFQDAARKEYEGIIRDIDEFIGEDRPKIDAIMEALRTKYHTKPKPR